MKCYRIFSNSEGIASVPDKGDNDGTKEIEHGAVLPICVHFDGGSRKYKSITRARDGATEDCDVDSADLIAGYGVVISYGGETLLNLFEYIGSETSNVAEVTGMLEALRLVKYAYERTLGKIRQLKNEGVTKLLVAGDFLNAMNWARGDYQCHSGHLQPLLELVTVARRSRGNFGQDNVPVMLQHAPREQNREADKLATEAIKSKASRKLKDLSGSSKASAVVTHEYGR